MAIIHDEFIQQGPIFPEGTDEATFLRQQLRFDLGETELIDPADSLGEVVADTEELPVSMAGEALPAGVKVREVLVKDPYVEADPDMYEQVTDYIDHIEDTMSLVGFNPFQTRHEATSQEEWNPITAAWLADAKVHSLGRWRHKVPSGAALGDLYDPTPGKFMGKDEQGNDILLSKEAAAQLRFVADGIAIRDRRSAMIYIAGENIGRMDLSGGTLTWLSEASGTADPSIRALKIARDVYGVEPELTVADHDRPSLHQTKENAIKNGLDPHQIVELPANILSPTFADKVEKETGRRKFMVVENLGFEEYLPQDGDELGAKKGEGLPQASEFTRGAWEFVAPGGVLISGNMVLDRPQVKFVFGAVDWPLINARSEESILRVYKEAGILDDPEAEVTMYRVKNATTGAHLYNIMAVRRKTAEELAASQVVPATDETAA